MHICCFQVLILLCNHISCKQACKRLGISNKENQSLVSMMAYRFGMHLQAEIHTKTKAYRIWTARNFNSKSSNAFPRKSKTVTSENKVDNLDIPNSLSTSESNIATPAKMNDSEITTEPSCGSNPQQILHEPRDTVPDAKHDSVGMEIETNAPSETAPTDSLKPFKSRSYQRYPCLSLTVDGAQREQRILERLQVFGIIHFSKGLCHENKIYFFFLLSYILITDPLFYFYCAE